MTAAIASPTKTPTETQYDLGYALDMWNEYNIDGFHEMASGEELKQAVRDAANAHQATQSPKTVSIWKDGAGRLQYTIKS